MCECVGVPGRKCGACHVVTGSVINYTSLPHTHTLLGDTVRISWFTTAWSNGYQTPDKCLVAIAQPSVDTDTQGEVTVRLGCDDSVLGGKGREKTDRAK